MGGLLNKSKTITAYQYKPLNENYLARKRLGKSNVYGSELSIGMTKKMLQNKARGMSNKENITSLIKECNTMYQTPMMTSRLGLRQAYVVSPTINEELLKKYLTPENTLLSYNLYNDGELFLEYFFAKQIKSYNYDTKQFVVKIKKRRWLCHFDFKSYEVVVDKELDIKPEKFPKLDYPMKLQPAITSNKAKYLLIDVKHPPKQEDPDPDYEYHYDLSTLRKGSRIGINLLKNVYSYDFFESKKQELIEAFRKDILKEYVNVEVVPYENDLYKSSVATTKRVFSLSVKSPKNFDEEVRKDLIIKKHFSNAGVLDERKYFDHVIMIENADYSKNQTALHKKPVFFEKAKSLDKKTTTIGLYAVFYFKDIGYVIRTTYGITSGGEHERTTYYKALEFHDYQVEYAISFDIPTIFVELIDLSQNDNAMIIEYKDKSGHRHLRAYDNKNVFFERKSIVFGYTHFLPIKEYDTDYPLSLNPAYSRVIDMSLQRLGIKSTPRELKIKQAKHNQAEASKRQKRYEIWHKYADEYKKETNGRDYFEDYEKYKKKLGLWQLDIQIDG